MLGSIDQKYLINSNRNRKNVHLIVSTMLVHFLEKFIFIGLDS